LVRNEKIVWNTALKEKKTVDIAAFEKFIKNVKLKIKTCVLLQTLYKILSKEIFHNALETNFMSTLTKTDIKKKALKNTKQDMSKSDKN
jgi:hypothetical protein